MSYEDNFWGALIAHYAKNICSIERALYHYYINSQSTVMARNQIAQLDRMKIETFSFYFPDYKERISRKNFVYRSELLIGMLCNPADNNVCVVKLKWLENWLQERKALVSDLESDSDIIKIRREQSMNINLEKQNIMYEIQNDQQNDMTYEKVDSYLRKYPGDTDVIIIKAYLLLLNDDIEDGIKKLEFVLQKCPFSVDALFLLG